MDANDGEQYPSVFPAAPNFAYELAARKTTDEDMAGLDLGDVHSIISGSERVHPATLRRFAERFARFNLRDARRYGPHMGWRKQRCTWRPARRGQPPKSSTSIPTNCPPAKRERCAERKRHTTGQLLRVPATRRADRRSRDPDRVSGGNGR